MEAEGYSELECQYQCFNRHEGVDDFTVVTDVPWTTFKSRVKPECEFIDVQCFRSILPVPVYKNLHNQILINRTRIEQVSAFWSKKKASDSIKAPTAPKAGVSVVLFVLDAVSHSNFLRSLPKTLKVLRDDLGAVVFDGYTKIGDNSFPNAMAILTGKRVTSIPGVESELPSDMSKTFFDDWPLVWRDFQKSGYLTYYAEDWPNFNLFTYLAKGFQFKPVDYYLRPFWLQLWGSFLHRRSTHLCFGNTPSHMLQLNYLKQFLIKYRAQGKFALQWHTELGHEWMNQLTLGDTDLASFFLLIQPYLNDTILFVLSDHGHRSDPIRETVVGRIEERMPWFSVVLPPWIRAQYPQILKNLKRNSHILTSPFDLHVTLRDILENQRHWTNLTHPIDAKRFSPRGSSLFRPITANRTCDEVGIPEEFCICQRESDINVTDSKVVDGAIALLKYINGLLSDYREQCAQLILKDVINAQVFLPNAKLIKSQISILNGESGTKGLYINYRITILTIPSDALFEGTLRNSLQDDSFTVTGDVNRINKYGNQSECIRSALLRKYCYCK